MSCTSTTAVLKSCRPRLRGWLASSASVPGGFHEGPVRDDDVIDGISSLAQIAILRRNPGRAAGASRATRSTVLRCRSRSGSPATCRSARRVDPSGSNRGTTSPVARGSVTSRTTTPCGAAQAGDGKGPRPPRSGSNQNSTLSPARDQIAAIVDLEPGEILPIGLDRGRVAPWYGTSRPRICSSPSSCSPSSMRRRGSGRPTSSGRPWCR